MSFNSDLQKIINSVQAIKQFIMGGTDGTPIGNTSDRLKVDANISGSLMTKKFRAIFDGTNQNLSGSSFQTIYSYSGSGAFWGTMIDTTQNGFQGRIEIDGEVVVDGSASVTDIQYSQSLLTNQNYGGGIFYQSVDFGDWGFSLPQPIPFSSSIVIKGKRDNNGSVTVNQYWVYLTKET